MTTNNFVQPIRDRRQKQSEMKQLLIHDGRRSFGAAFPDMGRVSGP
jgi:hypothetical protein